MLIKMFIIFKFNGEDSIMTQIVYRKAASSSKSRLVARLG